MLAFGSLVGTSYPESYPVDRLRALPTVQGPPINDINELGRCHHLFRG